MSKKNRGNYSTLREVTWLFLGELVVSALIVGVYLIVNIFLPGAFSYRVLLGAALGSAVTIANYLVLTVTVNRAIDSFMEKRGTEEMDEDAALEFANKNAMAVQNAATRSYILRMLSMAATLVLAFVFLKVFDPISTAVPLLMFRPILFVVGLIRKKGGRSHGSVG